MNCNPVPPPLSNPVLHAKAVQDLQTLFQTELAWIENVYPITRVGVTKVGTSNFNYPQVYSGTGSKYFDVRPNSALSSYGFFEVNSSFSVDKDQDIETYNLSFIVWYNLPRMDGSKGYDYSSELIGHVLKVIRESSLNSAVGEITIDTNPEDIFDKYSMEQSETQFLMYPYGAFKLTFDYTLYEQADCYEEFITATGGCE